MDRRFEEQLRIENVRWRRRAFVVLIGFVGFLAGLYSSSHPDHILMLTVGLVIYFAIVRMIPDRWFGRVRPGLITDGPRPALRSQSLPPSAREKLMYWPPREGPLPPVPPGARRPHERTQS